VGARWYDIEVDLEGSANSSFSTGFILQERLIMIDKDLEQTYPINTMDLEEIQVILH